MRPTSAVRSLAWLLLCTLVLTSGTGCFTFAANLIHAIKGNKRPAEYNALKGKKVAIVCSTDSGLSSNQSSELLTRFVRARLEENVKDIKIVRQEEVNSWIDSHSWTEADYKEIGKGVGADQLLAISLTNLSLRDGMTLYKGKCDIKVTVYDIKDEGNIVYRKQIPEFEFPKIGGQAVTDSTESKFRGYFISIVSEKIATLFYDAEANQDVALDATLSNL
ncbi:MAG: hypothetical protein U0892_22500 [Pirellulales bacterium]